MRTAGRWLSRCRALVVPGAAALLLVVVPSAWAGTAYVDGFTAVYAANPGEVNDVTFNDGADSFGVGGTVFRDTGAAIVAGPGCTTLVDGGVICSPEGGLGNVSISLGDRDDKLFNQFSSSDFVTVRGDDGDDHIRLNPQAAIVFGGADNDVIRAGGNGSTGPIYGGHGSDTVTMDDPGDVYGEEGNDTVTNVLGIDALTSGGPGDDILSDGEQMSGGDGNDILAVTCGVAFGDEGADHLYTDPSYRDECPARFDGGSGPDVLVGSTSEAFPDLLDGGPGNDVVNGLAGHDELLGGVGADALDGGPGFDHLSGGPGDDALDSVDGEADIDECGDGRDAVRADKTLDSLAGDCEKVKPGRVRV